MSYKVSNAWTLTLLSAGRVPRGGWVPGGVEDDFPQIYPNVTSLTKKLSKVLNTQLDTAPWTENGAPHKPRETYVDRKLSLLFAGAKWLLRNGTRLSERSPNGDLSSWEVKGSLSIWRHDLGFLRPEGTVLVAHKTLVYVLVPICKPLTSRCLYGGSLMSNHSINAIG